jgi:hypothetical protein
VVLAVAIVAFFFVTVTFALVKVAQTHLAEPMLDFSPRLSVIRVFFGELPNS